jgi:hypothetical protein
MKFAKLVFALHLLFDSTRAQGGLRKTTQPDGRVLEDFDESKRSDLKLPFFKGYSIGRGVNVVTGKAGDVAFTVKATTQQKEGEYTYSSLTTTSVKETEDAVEFIASAEGGGYGFTAGPAISWANSKQQKTETVCLIAAVTATSKYEFAHVQDIENFYPEFFTELKDCKAQPDVAGRRLCFNDFTNKYGTHYISGIQHGGNAFSRI